MNSRVVIRPIRSPVAILRVYRVDGDDGIRRKAIAYIIHILPRKPIRSRGIKMRDISTSLGISLSSNRSSGAPASILALNTDGRTTEFERG